jgi:hypothetical protein
MMWQASPGIRYDFSGHRVNSCWGAEEPYNSYQFRTGLTGGQLRITFCHDVAGVESTGWEKNRALP